MLETCTQAEKAQIMNKIKPQIVQMCKHKYGSNFIEKCLLLKEPIQQDYLDFIISSLRSDTEKCNLIDLVRDQFGNFVIQRCLDTADEYHREVLIEKLVSVGPLIKKHNQHSRHVFNHLDKKYKIKVRTKAGSREDSKASQCSSQQSLQSRSSLGRQDLAPMKTLAAGAQMVFARPPIQEELEENQQEGAEEHGQKLKVKIPRKRNRKPKVLKQMQEDA